MSSTITITLDAQGNMTNLSDLPEDVFYSRFATPPDALIRDVLSINAADSYTLVINAPTMGNVEAAAPATFVSASATQAIVSVGVSQLPDSQEFGLVTCQLSASVSYQLGILVNSANLSVPMVINPEASTFDFASGMPIGIHCAPVPQRISIWAAGNYTLDLSLIESSGYEMTQINGVSGTIAQGGQTATVPYSNLTTTSGFQMPFSITCVPTGESAAAMPPNPLRPTTIDPTIVNNPINQGGGDGTMDDPGKHRYELVGAGAD